MIIMPVPKDIRNIQSKFLGPFTKRQAYSVIAAGAVSAAIYLVISPFIGADTSIIFIFILDLPILACGFIDVNGMPFLTYMQDVFIIKLLTPKTRVYKTENVFGKYAEQNRITYEYFDGDLEEYTEKEKKKKNKLNQKRLAKFLRENPNMEPVDVDPKDKKTKKKKKRQMKEGRRNVRKKEKQAR